MQSPQKAVTQRHQQTDFDQPDRESVDDEVSRGQILLSRRVHDSERLK